MSSIKSTLKSASPWHKKVGLLATCLIVGATALFAANAYLTDTAIERASQAAQSAIAFARQSVARHEENSSNATTRSITSLWEKTKELESRYDVANGANRKDVEDYLAEMNIDAVFLLDGNGNLNVSYGDSSAAGVVEGKIAENSDFITNLVQSQQKSYLARVDVDGTAYDYAAFASSSLEGGIVVGVNRVEIGDVNSTQSMFNAMFDQYSIGMDGIIAVTNNEEVLASNNSALIGTSREVFESELLLDSYLTYDNLLRGTYQGSACYGLKTTSNGYDVYVWFSQSRVFSERNAQLIALCFVCVLFALAVLAVYIAIENSQLRREHKYLESLERANMAKTDFLRRMSHDVRTPINGIRGMLAIGDHYADDLQKQAECRAKMWEASSFLLDLVNSALDMNKLESGQMTFESKAFDVVKMVDSVVDMLRIQADERGIELKANTNVRHRMLVGSPVHVRQVLQNVTSNAIKYNKAGGHVCLECIEATEMDGRVTLRFVCTDDGIGMSREFQKHAFEAFAQENDGARASYQGTGLGLAISREIVEHMGGKIGLKSVKGQGSTFTIELPFMVASDIAESLLDKNDKKTCDLRGMRVLLAEDNDLNREVAMFMLEQQGILVETASNGQEALTRFESSPVGYYDTILMDVMMPVINGIEATRAIRRLERPDARRIPIIAVTANAFSDDKEASRGAGMTDHVSKPLDAKKLIDTISRHHQ